MISRLLQLVSQAWIRREMLEMNRNSSGKKAEVSDVVVENGAYHGECFGRREGHDKVVETSSFCW